VSSADPQLRRCGRCQRDLPFPAFGRYGARHQSYCRDCKREYDAAWYRANKAKRQARVRADRAAHVEWMNSLKEGRPCADCGQAFPPYVMEWDHLPGTEKTLVLADTRRAAYGRRRILAELAKCELVCANCHRERTFGQRRRNAA
jgi:hypothetical protein